jgi:DNA repair protein RadC
MSKKKEKIVTTFDHRAAVSGSGTNTVGLSINQVQLVREQVVRYDNGAAVTTSELARDVFKPIMYQLTVEECHCIALNAKNAAIDVQLISRGTIGASLVHPREVFRYAVLSGASAVILGHNHPSGSSDPSSEDRRLTARIRRAGEILGIPLLDHVIIGDDSYFSFADIGWE